MKQLFRLYRMIVCIPILLGYLSRPGAKIDAFTLFIAAVGLWSAYQWNKNRRKKASVFKGLRF